MKYQPRNFTYAYALPGSVTERNHLTIVREFEALRVRAIEEGWERLAETSQGDHAELVDIIKRLGFYIIKPADMDSLEAFQGKKLIDILVPEDCRNFEGGGSHLEDILGFVQSLPLMRHVEPAEDGSVAFVNLQLTKIAEAADNQIRADQPVWDNDDVPPPLLQL